MRDIAPVANDSPDLLALQVMLLDRLEICREFGYDDCSASTEPTALSAMALLAGGRHQAAQRALNWLVTNQQPNGCVAPDTTPDTPGWTTGWATLAYLNARYSIESERLVCSPVDKKRYDTAAQLGLDWLVSHRGQANDRDESEEKPLVQMDVTLRGWAWVSSTFSWVEPTSMGVLALKAAGHAEHPIVREAVCCLLDRIVPDGGWNYGNTIIMGSELPAQIQPTGIALAALADEPGIKDRLRSSIDFLVSRLGGDTAPCSLAYGLIGLAAHGVYPKKNSAWLRTAYERPATVPMSAYSLVMLALATMPDRAPWLIRCTRVPIRDVTIENETEANL